MAAWPYDCGHLVQHPQKIERLTAIKSTPNYSGAEQLKDNWAVLGEGRANTLVTLTAVLMLIISRLQKTTEGMIIIGLHEREVPI